MNINKILTVVIPTRNRPEYLKECLKSVVNQTFKDFEILVLDNHSDLGLNPIIESIKDPRIKLIRHSENIGIISNWNKAIELTNSKYISIFHDDDVMLPDFLMESVKALENNPEAVFSYCMANKVDKDGQYLSLWSDLYPNVGLIKAPDYLIYTAEKCCCITIAPTVVFRRKIFDSVGFFNGNLIFNSFDFNMYLRIAINHDIYFINKIMVNYRVHEKQMSQDYWWTGEKIKGKTATMIEIQNALWKLIRENYQILKTKKGNSIIESGDKTTKQLSLLLKKIMPDI